MSHYPRHHPHGDGVPYLRLPLRHRSFDPVSWRDRLERSHFAEREPSILLRMNEIPVFHAHSLAGQHRWRDVAPCTAPCESLRNFLVFDVAPTCFRVTPIPARRHAPEDG